MAEIETNTFPLEDKYISKVEMYSDGFFYAKDVPNGALIKAPYDCKVKSVFKTNQSAYLPGAFNTILSDPYDVYDIVLVSLDGKKQFSISDILPNDKARNIGAEFREKENVGRVLSPDRTFAYKFYENIIVNPEAPKREQKTEFVPVDPDRIQQNTTESADAEIEAKKWKMPSKFTMFGFLSLGVFAFYVAKKYK